MRIKNDLGYTKNMSGLKGSKILTTLEKLIRSNGVVMNRIELVATAIVEGFVPMMEKNYSYYSAKLGGNTKPKTRYTLELENDKSTSMYEVTKTEFEFANWLIDNNITTEDAVKKFEEDEEKRVQAIEDEERRISEELKRKVDQDKESERQFDAWVDEETRKIVESNDSRIELVRNIFIDEIDMFSEYHLSLLVFIDNIDDSRCIIALKNRLYNTNKASKKAFYHITGIKLPKTDKGTRELLDSITSVDLKGLVPYKTSVDVDDNKNQDVNEETFYIVTNKGYNEIKGFRLENKYNLELFFHEFDESYKITHIPTGICIAHSIGDKKDLTKKVEEFVDYHGINQVSEMFDNAIKKYGLVPNYTPVETLTDDEVACSDDGKI